MGIKERKEKERMMRRNEIINAAEEVFFIKGFDHTTMDEIAMKAEFTKKTIYQYFIGKEEIYFEIMLRGFNTLNQMIQNAFDQKHPQNGFEKTYLLGQLFIAFNDSYPFYFKAIMDYENKEFDFNEDDQNPLVKDCYVAGQYSSEQLEKFIREGIEENEIRNDTDPKILALVLWSSMAGVIGMTNKKEKYIKAYYKVNVSDVIEEGFKIILNSIKK